MLSGSPTVASLAPLLGEEKEGHSGRHLQHAYWSLNPTDAVNDYYSVAQRAAADHCHQQQIKDAGLPALTRDNVPVEIAANIGSALEAPGAFTCGAQGIGLFSH